MRFLIEAHHPAHIHFWKYPVRELIARGHAVLLIGRDRDVMKRLLEVYDWIPSEIPPRRTQRNRFPMLELLQRQWQVGRAILRFKPDVVASLMGSYCQSAKLLGKPNLVFTDSEFQHFNHRIAHPFADAIYTPECFTKELGRKQQRYEGIHELVFLRQPAPQPKPGHRQMLVRLSAWNTLHDVGAQGIGELIYPFIERFSAKFEIVISAEEGKIPPGLEHLALGSAPEDFHRVIGESTFVLSEGASTASEAACLGVPSVCVNSTEARGYLRMLEQDFGLVRVFQDPQAGMREATALADAVAGSGRGAWTEKARLLHARYPAVDGKVVEILLGAAGDKGGHS